MKNAFKLFGIIALLIMGFYYTEKMSNIVISNNSLVMEINDLSSKYNISPVSANINDEYIIPGLNGYAVNVLKSYDNMKYLNDFRDNLLEYDIIKPNISIDNNKDKIIKYGNSYKNSITIIINNNIDIINYSINNKINITRLVDIHTIDPSVNYEQINNDYEKYDKTESVLNKNNMNTNICYVSNIIESICRDKKKYLVNASIILNNNINEVKKSIKSGYIIFISDDVSLEIFKILLKEIYYKDLNIVYLSKLISEQRD